jgi:GT2 family glycosyltransferase
MAAQGKVLIFVDDDIRVGTDFISQHLVAHQKWPGALVVGSVRLPNGAMAKPFVRFRQRIEDGGVPEMPGPTPIQNFCTAQNMSISRDLFQDVGGFDPNIVSGEDQDFALRHTALGRKVVFWPEAAAVHEDNALDIRGYCRRVEWGSKHVVQFCRRHPNWPDNIERERVNSPLRWGAEPVSLNLNKLTKSILVLTPFCETLLLTAAVLERVTPNSRALEKLYRLLLGVHIRRGYSQGAKPYKHDVDWRKPTAQTAKPD